MKQEWERGQMAEEDLDLAVIDYRELKFGSDGV